MLSHNPRTRSVPSRFGKICFFTTTTLSYCPFRALPLFRRPICGINVSKIREIFRRLKSAQTPLPTVGILVDRRTDSLFNHCPLISFANPDNQVHCPPKSYKIPNLSLTRGSSFLLPYFRLATPSSPPSVLLHLRHFRLLRASPNRFTRKSYCSPSLPH